MGEIAEMKKQQEEILERVQKLMGWDLKKAFRWYVERNPHFGNVSPSHMVYVGRGKKVLGFITARETETDGGYYALLS